MRSLSLEVIRGKAWKFGDNVDTDVILPGKYLILTDPHEIAKHAMEGIAPGFSSKISKGDVIVAGRNFGCGSSREHAPIALKYAGIGAVVAKSFARIFFRNSINVGLPVAECPEAFERVEEGDLVEVDLANGVFRDLTKGFELKITPYPEFLMDILKSGGLVQVLKKRFGRHG